MVLSEEKVGHLEEEARKRRERLARLKRRRPGNEADPDEDQHTDSHQTDLPKPVFRNYRATDEVLQQSQLSDTPAGDVEQLVQPIIDRVAEEQQKEANTNLDMSRLAPRKPDWDLKRDLAARLERLERRTQRSIAELIRQRLHELRRPEDLADAVSAAAAVTAAKLTADVE